MTEHFTETDPVAEIAALWQPAVKACTMQPGDVTNDDMCIVWGCSHTTAERRLNELTRRGLLVQSKARRQDGRIVYVWRKVV